MFQYQQSDDLLKAIGSVSEALSGAPPAQDQDIQKAVAFPRQPVAAGAAPNQQGMARPQDAINLSREANQAQQPRVNQDQGANQAQDKQLLDAMWNNKLATEAQAAMAEKQKKLQGEQPDVNQGGGAIETLAKDYEQAKQLGVQIDPKVEELIRQVLDMKQNDQGNNNGGVNPIDGGANGADGANGGGGGADGGAGVDGGGGGGGAPIDGGGGGGGPIDGGGGGGYSGNNGDPSIDRNLGPVNTQPDGATQGSWSKDDEANLDKALAEPTGKINEDHISAWRQGGQGNCASVGTIKAAMETYGNKVFDSVTKTQDGGYQVKMQDGRSVSVSRTEMDIAKSMSNWRGSGESRSYATLAFAAMGKRAAESGYEGARSFRGALRNLNSGQYPVNTARLLGLGGQMERVNSNTRGAVGWNNAHAVMMRPGPNGGWQHDMYGNRRSGGYGFSSFGFKPFPANRTSVNANNGAAGGTTPRPTSAAPVAGHARPAGASHPPAQVHHTTRSHSTTSHRTSTHRH